MDHGGDPVDQAKRLAVEVRAQSKALQKLKDSDVNFAQFFAEANQTAGLFVQTTKMLAKGIRNLKRGDISGALKAYKWGSSSLRRKAAASIKRDISRLGKDIGGSVGDSKWVANAHLAVVFGWLPLLSDLDGACKNLAKKATEDPKRTRFHVISNVKESLNSEQYVTRYGEHTTTITKGLYGCKTRFDFFFSNAQLASLAADGLTNPLAIAWELMPYSFVVDWCSGVGEYVNSLDASLGKTMIGGSSTWYEKWTRNATVGASAATYRCKGGYDQSRTYMRRYVHTDFPNVVNIVQQLKNPLKNVKRIATALALLRQQYK
jgi:hypothetical protein